MKTFIADAVDSVFKVVDLSSQTHEEDLLREMQELLLVIAVGEKYYLLYIFIIWQGRIEWIPEKAVEAGIPVVMPLVLIQLMEAAVRAEGQADKLCLGCLRLAKTVQGMWTVNNNCTSSIHTQNAYYSGIE